MYDNIEHLTGAPSMLLAKLDEYLSLSTQDVTNGQMEYVYHKYNNNSHWALWLVAEKLAPLKGKNPFQHRVETKYYLTKLLPDDIAEELLASYTDEYLQSTFKINRVYIDGVRLPITSCLFKKGQIRIEPLVPVQVKATPWVTHEDGIYKVYVGIVPYRFSQTHIKGGDLLLVT